jgi:hypothetical protein
MTAAAFALGSSCADRYRRTRQCGIRIATLSIQTACESSSLPLPPSTPAPHENWLDLDSVGRVEVTSEDSAHPIESALISGEKPGWRAARPGTQTIRLIFDEPQTLSRICLVFEEHEKSRTQEFVLRWSPDRGHSFREIVRQQWNFSPRESMHEVEDYALDLSSVSVVELTIVPDISGGDARASLSSLRLAGSKSSNG